jgi:hypothetical protein
LKARKLAFGFIVMITLLAACSGNSASPTVPPAATAPVATTPVEAVKDFFAAIYSGQDVSALVCSTPGVGDAFRVAAAASAAMPGASVDISGLTYTVKDQTADSATVTVAGKITTNVIGNSSSVDFPTADISVVNESGWKFCGPAD